jgi:hypothetical protein
MRPSYDDITSHIAEEPVWYDEHGVPRYRAFEPGLLSVYAVEAALVEIACQNCERRFLVSVAKELGDLHTLQIDEDFEYGDPPNAGCCPSGPTMSSIPKRIIEFWSRVGAGDWTRDLSRERPLACAWNEDEEQV